MVEAEGFASVGYRSFGETRTHHLVDRILLLKSLKTASESVCHDLVNLYLSFFYIFCLFCFIGHLWWEIRRLGSQYSGLMMDWIPVLYCYRENVKCYLMIPSILSITDSFILRVSKLWYAIIRHIYRKVSPISTWAFSISTHCEFGHWIEKPYPKPRLPS